MKEDFSEFLGDERVTNTIIDAHNYIQKENENKLQHKNFYLLVILFVSSQIASTNELLIQTI